MSKLFEIENISKKNPIIKPKPECWIIKPLRAVIDEYPEDYPKIIAYLHFMKSMRINDSPYADVDIDLREEQILRDLGLDINPEDEIIKEALQCVEDKYYTTFYGIYKGVKAFMDRVGKELVTTKPDFNAKDGNMAPIRQFLKEYNALSINFKQAYRDFDEEVGNSRIKGGGRESYDAAEEDDNLMDD